VNATSEEDMAEIHVEKKRGSMVWLWVLILLIVLALVGWWLWQSGMLGGAVDAVTPADTIARAAAGLAGSHA
jgi:predicted negative regulator of RcsB-dependent stress response